MLRLTSVLALAPFFYARATGADPTPTAASMARQGLEWLTQSGLLTVGQQIGGGENVERLAEDEAMVWHDANTVEMLADYTLATGDPSYVSVLEAYKTYDPVYVFGRNTLLASKNDYNDDKLWWALAMLRVYDVTHDPVFLNRAKKVFVDVCASWGSAPSCHASGIPWARKSASEKPYLNAITNELFFETAAKLAQRAPTAMSVCGGGIEHVTVTSPAGVASTYPDTYLGWAAAEYRWFTDYWFPPADVPPGFDAPPNPVGRLPIPDGLGSDCIPGHAGHRAKWTYNQGVILGALLDLALLEKNGGDPSGLVPDPPEFLLGLAFQIAEAAMASFSQIVNGTPILAEKNERATERGCQNPNCPQFKGIFMRFLGRLAEGTTPSDPGYSTFAAAAVPFLTTNAQSIWRNRLPGGVTPQSGTSAPSFPSKWSTPGGALNFYQATQTSAIDAIVASIGQAASPTASPAPLPAAPTQKPRCSVQPRCGGGLAVSCQRMANGAQPEWPVAIYELTSNGHYKTLGRVTSSSAPALEAATGDSVRLVTCETNVAGSACDTPVVVVAGPACPRSSGVDTKTTP